MRAPDPVPILLATVPPPVPPKVKAKVAPIIVPVLVILILPASAIILLEFPRVIKPLYSTAVAEVLVNAPAFKNPEPFNVKDSAAANEYPFRSSVEPDAIIVPLAVTPKAVLAALPAPPIFNTPPFIVVKPEYKLLPDTKSVPDPVLVYPMFAPAFITPLIVRSFAAVPSSSTKKVLLVAPKASGDDILAPPIPVPALLTIILPPRLRVLIPVIDEPLAAPQNIVIPAQLPAVVIVTVIPALIVTGTPAVGVEADPATPPAVAAQIGPFQLPEVTANLCANTLPGKNRLAIIKIKRKEIDWWKKTFIISSF